MRRGFLRAVILSSWKWDSFVLHKFECPIISNLPLKNDDEIPTIMHPAAQLFKGAELLIELIDEEKFQSERI